jgi:hypothetical protein
MNTNFNKNKMTHKHFETKQAEVSDTKLIETIETKLSKLCKTGGRSLSMSVPPQVSDMDMAICELIRRYKQLIIADVSNKKSARTSLPLTNQALWDMAKTITDKQKEAFNLTKPVDWTSVEEDWFDWLEEGIFGEEP